MISNELRGNISAVRVHPLQTSRLAGAGWSKHCRVTDAQLKVKEAGGGGHATVPGVGLLDRVAVLHCVDTNPGLICWRNRCEDTDAICILTKFTF